MREHDQGWRRPGFLDVESGHLTVDGVDCVGLAEEYGTPLYLFSERRISGNVRELQRAVQSVFPRTKLCYASKANSNMAVLSAVKRAGGDLEVNSGGELFKARAVGFKPDQIVFNGVSKTDEEIREAIEFGILALNVDSLFELEQIAGVARRVGLRANISIRIVPEIVTRSHIGLQTGLLSSKFGLSPSQVDEALTRALELRDHVNLTGVHIHIGSQTPDPQPFVRAFAEMWRLLVDLHARTGHRLSHINVGGGLPIDYLPEPMDAGNIDKRARDMLSATLDVSRILEMALSEAGARENADLLEGLILIMEPGRRIIGDAGLLLTRVCNIKERPETGDVWLLTDAGYSLMLSMATYKWYYHVVSATRAGDAHDTPFKVAGPLCDSGDVYFDIEQGTRLPNYRSLPAKTTVGDVLALLNTGAYALDQASQYNGRPRPAAVMIRETGDVALARRRETYEDLCAFDVW
jgi:D-ornithine/D-lysine decarboxylase